VSTNKIDDVNENELGDTPEVDEIYQREPDLITVPVRVEGPTPVWELPRTFGLMKSFTIPADLTQPVEIVGEDPRRAAVTLWATGEDLVLADDQQMAFMRQGVILSAGLAVPVHFQARSRLFVMPTTGAVEDSVLSVVTEQWSR
jgi:hypothetical protein